MKSGKEHALLKGVKTYIFNYLWSPDSKKILWSEKKNTLNITDVATGKTEQVEQSVLGGFYSFNWSPDSKWITYVRPERDMNNIIVYNTGTKEKHVITDGWYDAGEPNFSSDGKYLVFRSDRTFNPIYSQTEWNHAYGSMGKVYILPLAGDAEIPFALINDEVTVKEEQPASKETKPNAAKAEDKKPETVVSYDFENIADRVVELPAPPSYYGGIKMVGKNIYYYRGGSYKMYNLDQKKETDLGVSLIFGAGYKKALAWSDNKFQIIDVPVAPVTISAPISLADVKKKVDYHEEWMQIYDESWRQMRDFFYARNMHGVDWDEVRTKYRVLVPYVNHRTDLTYLIGEMIGELSVGHAYSQNGEHPEPARIPMGMLGAKFSKDKSGYFKVESITRGANWDSSTRSPLTMPGVDVKVGDYILAINGNSLKEAGTLSEMLIDKAGKTVELEVNSAPSANGARKVLVVPLDDVSKLNYYNWVAENTRKVNEATKGEVGYIHIPDMGVDGLNEFAKHYYPQLSKKALIIDDRGNGGGNISPMLIERLLRTPTFFTMHTNQKEGSVSPVATFLGPKVLLANEYSASDGDLFPYRFKFNKLGTFIGKRTWGGVVGYSGTIPVVDGGSIVTPSYAPYAADGSGFIIEGHGVDPDIELANDPYKDYMGEDEQLDKAIQVALEKLKTERKDVPAIPAFPDKSKRK